MNRRRQLLLAAGGLVVVLAWPVERLHHYMEHDPSFCRSCHLMEAPYGAWARSEHSKVDCHECHVSSITGNLERLYYTWFDPRAAVGPHEPVEARRCLACHESRGQARWARVLETAGHKAHVAGRKPEPCTACHAASVHRFRAPPELCAKCHKDVGVHERGMAGLDCLACHRFLDAAGAPDALKPGVATCRRCHRDGSSSALAGGPGLGAATSTRAPAGLAGALRADVGTSTEAPAVLASAVHGDRPCAECHDPHGATLEARRPGRACARCHADVVVGPAAAATAHGGERVAERTPGGHGACQDCHEPHGARGAAAGTCGRCHPDQATRLHHAGGSEGGLAGPSSAGRRGPAEAGARRTGPSGAGRTAQHPGSAGGPDACASCHRPHAFRLDDAECRACHVAGARVARGAGTDASRGGARAPGVTAAGVVPDGPRAAAASRAHRTVPEGVLARHRCVTCHPVHAEAAGPVPCGQCHAEQAALVVRAEALPHRACATCHEPHGRPVPVEARCSACHLDRQALGSGSHDPRCGNCHPQHGPPRATRALCARCHATVAPAPRRGGAAHEACSNCHDLHGRAAPGAACLTCHQGQDRRSPAPAVAEHQRCSTCHAGHDVAAGARCASCHAAEGAAAERGPHQDCRGCHPAHPASGPAPTDCGRCHARIARAVASFPPNAATHRRCEICHPAHAADAVPACVSCHADVTKKRLHQVAQHQACATCHRPHEDREPAPAVCLSCHADRVGHFPDAKRCSSCHPF